MSTSGAQALNDLEWVLGSPSLIDDPLAVSPHQLDRSAVDVEHLQAFLAAKPEHRVGRYFERLVLYWLVHIRQVELVGAGVPITDCHKRTLGEIDFLFRDEHGALSHWETAVKFFLHYPNDVGSHFPGPAARDNFERKSMQLFDKQLPMSEQHVPDVRARRVFVRGRVFERTGVPRPVVLPARLAAGRLGGVWVRKSEIAELESFGDVGFHIVNKPFWFSPTIDGEVFGWEAFSNAIASHFEGPAYPVMVSIRKSDLQEIERCFVVSDRWPQDSSN